ncbi:Flagellum site-determining protein YlxH [Bremerella volcania]|uniref:Iron-sulfur cluster carrier protein n=1 Tax=Bremerella volcania TaxID=2527984 RepID=A0A518C547_9BACT|nr:Mrp/NBP35 family ATP-binding protein [Bremerella volcania]QDU74351.1 Flagellum site-determining protein YlxH [Bremerella volcania]
MADVQQVIKALEGIKDPYCGRSITTTDQVKEVDVNGTTASFILELTTHSAPLWEETKERVKQHVLKEVPELKEVNVQLREHQRKIEPIGQIGLTARSVIAVGSGKGGVGKSTVASCLAYALKKSGAKVGLMDADIYGPSIPHLLGVGGRPEVIEKRIQPKEVDGMKVISMGLIVEPGEAVIWRGPMLHGAVTQFLRDTDWGPLDYLIIDMPPGTGDIALTLSQLLPLTGSVVVCTPQEVALLDAIKAVAMFRKVKIPVLGMVENMSGFVCPDTGKQWDIFGRGGAQRKAQELDVPFLGDVPITMSIRQQGDAGKTSDVLQNEVTAPRFEQLAYNLVKQLADSAAEKPPIPSLTVL